MAAKLPKYVFRRANGSYRYKRNVPRHLQVLLGKSTLSGTVTARTENIFQRIVLSCRNTLMSIFLEAFPDVGAEVNA